MRKNQAFSLQTVLDSLPGYPAQIAKRSGFSETTTRRHIAWLIAHKQAHQTGWHSAGKWVATYAAGEAPSGFVLPPKPKRRTVAQRDRMRRMNYKTRARINAQRRANYARKKQILTTSVAEKG